MQIIITVPILRFGSLAAPAERLSTVSSPFLSDYIGYRKQLFIQKTHHNLYFYFRLSNLNSKTVTTFEFVANLQLCVSERARSRKTNRRRRRIATQKCGTRTLCYETWTNQESRYCHSTLVLQFSSHLQCLQWYTTYVQCLNFFFTVCIDLKKSGRLQGPISKVLKKKKRIESPLLCCQF